MKYFFFLCVLSCVDTHEVRTYFTYEQRKLCVSKSLLVKLFPESIAYDVGDDQTALFRDTSRWMGNYVLLAREGCWEVVDVYPYTQNVLQINLLKPDSLVVWYELYPECVVTQSYLVTKNTITPY